MVTEEGMGAEAMGGGDGRQCGEGMVTGEGMGAEARERRGGW